MSPGGRYEVTNSRCISMKDDKEDVKKWTTVGLTMFVFLQLIQSVEAAYLVEMDVGHDNNCFFERVPAGVKLGFTFEVLDGGFYDIDVEIRDPKNMVVHRDDKATEGKFTIEADTEGPYFLCFSNSRTTASPKSIMFQIDRSDSAHHQGSLSSDGEKLDDETKKMSEMVDNLLSATLTSRHDVRFLTARDRVHRRINDATNSRIVWWSGVEFILLLCVTLGQVWYLRRFFEIRRKV